MPTRKNHAFDPAHARCIVNDSVRCVIILLPTSQTLFTEVKPTLHLQNKASKSCSHGTFNIYFQEKMLGNHFVQRKKKLCHNLHLSLHTKGSYTCGSKTLQGIHIGQEYQTHSKTQRKWAFIGAKCQSLQTFKNNCAQSRSAVSVEVFTRKIS